MKPQPILFTLLMVAAFFFSACHKDKSNDGSNSNNNNNNNDTTANNNNDTTVVEEPYVLPTGDAAMILGKWQVNTIVINNHINGADNVSTITGTPDDYVDFQTDGKMYTFVQGVLDVSNYRVHGVQEITIDGDPAKVKRLTDTKLMFSSRDQTGTFGYTEVTYDLRK